MTTYIYNEHNLKTGEVKTIELDYKISMKANDYSIKYDKISYTLVDIILK